MRASQSRAFFGIDATAPGAAKPCRGKGAPLCRCESAGPNACRWEIRDSATPLADHRLRRRGLRPRSACPREIDWAGDRFASSLNAFGPPRQLQATSIARSMTRERQLFREGAQGAVNVVDSCGKRLNPSPAQVGYIRLGPAWNCRTRASPSSVGRVASEASRVGVVRHLDRLSWLRFPHPAAVAAQRRQVYAACVNLAACGHPPLRGGIQRSKPLSRARSLSEASGRAPRCPMTSAAASAPSLAAVR
jgi:hypothetical protein